MLSLDVAHTEILVLVGVQMRYPLEGKHVNKYK